MFRLSLVNRRGSRRGPASPFGRISPTRATKMWRRRQRKSPIDLVELGGSADAQHGSSHEAGEETAPSVHGSAINVHVKGAEVVDSGT